MNNEIRRLIDQAWANESSCNEMAYAHEMHVARTAASGSGPTNAAAALLSKALLTLIADKAGKLVQVTREIYAAHGQAPSEAEAADLVASFNRTLAADKVDLLHRMEQVKDLYSRRLPDPTSQLFGKVSARLTREFELMLAALRTARTQKDGVTVTLGDVANLQIGNHNVQFGQVTILRDIVSKIDASPATEAEKADAKGLLSKFLEHPVTAAVVGAIAGKVFNPK